ncbi:MAG TPA: glycoside hydrolase domain-containing protein [Prolixibacteraceae bacterium]
MKFKSLFYLLIGVLLVVTCASAQTKYVQSAILNGEPLNRPWFEHSTLMKGGTLVLNMGPRPNKQWGSSLEAIPPSMSKAE